jgi:hypothetical protein
LLKNPRYARRKREFNAKKGAAESRWRERQIFSLVPTAPRLRAPRFGAASPLGLSQLLTSQRMPPL